MTRVVGSLPSSPQLRNDELDGLATKPFSPLAAAMSQQLHQFDVPEPTAPRSAGLSLNQLHALAQQSGLHTTTATMTAALPHPHLVSSSTGTASTYAAMMDDVTRGAGGVEPPAVYAQRLWMQPREVNIVFGRDVIQVPLKVENSNNEYVNLVLSHREFDVMAVHIPKYDQMQPTMLLDEITRHTKELIEKQKVRRQQGFPLSNQLGEFPDSDATFQARILELEYELSRLKTKLTASTAVQTTLRDENALLRSNMEELEQHCLENKTLNESLKTQNETLTMQNDVLREQSVEALTQNTKLKKMLVTTTQELKDLSSQVNVLRTQVRSEQTEIAAQVDQSMLTLIANVRERENVLQESYLTEKKERQLMAEKFYEISGRIRVFCRVRPLMRNVNKTASSAVLRPKPNSLLIERNGKEFTFDQVFGPENSQADVYAQMEPVVISFVDGYNACIMAYGQTGTGKTHTMMGGAGDLQGMIPRALQQVFSIVNSRQLTYKDTLTVSMVEIYNDQILDLLTEGESGVKIKNESDITLRSVTLWEHVNAVLAEGNANRNIASTSMNLESSRSHALVFLNLESQHRETMEIRRSTLCLVDLAGSERISRSQVEGDRLKEAQHINKSLSALGDVMHALQHKAKHVPYRNSKLTFMLRDMLSGQAKTLMMLQLSPDDDDVEETICSLQFGARVSQIQMGAVKTSIESGEIFKLKEENRTLEKRIAKLEDQAMVWKLESQNTQEELKEARTMNEQLQSELGQHQDDLSLLQEKFEAVAVASASSTSPPPSPGKSDAPPSPTHSANSARSTTSTSSAPGTTPTTSRYATPAPTGSVRTSRSVAQPAGVAPRPTVSRPTPRSNTTTTTASPAPTPAERLARRKSLTTLNSPSTATVLSARERLARATNDPQAQANRRATLGAIGTSGSQSNLSASVARTRATAGTLSSSSSPTTTGAARPAAPRRANSLATTRTTTGASGSPSRTAAASSTSSTLRTSATLEKRRSLASSRTTPSTPVTSASTARTRPTATATSGARRPTSTFAA